MKRLKSLSVVFLASFVLFACATPPDYTLLRNENPIKILVMPPDNQSPELRGTYTFLSTITKPLAEKGYYVYPVDVVDQYFKTNGISLAEEMNLVPLKKLNEQFAPDAILYTRIDYFGQKFMLISSATIIQGELTLVSAKTGEVLWKQPLFYSNDSGQQNVLAAIIVQAITSALGEGRYFGVSSIANETAINNATTGLLTGAMLATDK